MVCFTATGVLLTLQALLSTCGEVRGQEQTQVCRIRITKRVRCGFPSITAEQCVDKGCCFQDVDDATPACYFEAESIPRFSQWLEWEECSKSCGKGEQKRNRYCQYVDGDQAPAELCRGNSTETKKCNMEPCDGSSGNTCVEKFTDQCSRRKDECEENEDLRSECPLTCNTCDLGTKPTADPTCKDILPTCKAAKQLCERSILEALKRYCPVTCGTCPDEGAGGGGGVEPTSRPTDALASGAPDHTSLPQTEFPLDQCVDEYETCDRVKPMCYDPQHIHFMTLYCRRTCDLCFVNPRPTTIPSATTKSLRPLPTIGTSSTGRPVVTEAPLVTTANRACADTLPGNRCSAMVRLCDVNLQIVALCRRTCGTCEDTVMPTPTMSQPTTIQEVTTASTTTASTAATEHAEVHESPAATSKTCVDTFGARCMHLVSYCGTNVKVGEMCRRTCGKCDADTTGRPLTSSQPTATTTQQPTTRSSTATAAPSTTQPLTSSKPTATTTQQPTTRSSTTTAAPSTTERTVTPSVSTITDPQSCVDKLPGTRCSELSRYCKMSNHLLSSCRRTCGQCGGQNTENTPVSSIQPTTMITERPTIIRRTTATTMASSATTLVTPCIDQKQYCIEIPLSLCGRSVYDHITSKCPKRCNKCNTTKISSTAAPTTRQTTTAAPTTTAASIQTTMQRAADCEDKHDRCPQLASRCNSPSHKTILSRFCPRSCNVNGCADSR